MKKRVGVFGLMLMGAGLMLQPAIAAADSFGHAPQTRVEQPRKVETVQYREPVVHRDVRDHGRRVIRVVPDVCGVRR
jgi:hypothetical protein